MKPIILVIGACGQLGSVLTGVLRDVYGKKSVIASDIISNKISSAGIFEFVDSTDMNRISEIVIKYKVTQIYHLAAVLSARGEKSPLETWDTNMRTFINVLEVSRKSGIEKVFFPSSIAVFGKYATKNNTPNETYLNPSTAYGISKAAAESWAEYYFKRYGLDVRSIRFPGIIGYQSKPGGGTTDYAIDIYYKAVEGINFSCFLREETKLPMIYMDDAIRAAIEIMEAPKENIMIRTSYNLSGMSFSPREVVESIRDYYPFFKTEFNPDFRQEIADNWPNTINDSRARIDWGWKPKFSLDLTTKAMIYNLRKQYSGQVSEKLYSRSKQN